MLALLTDVHISPKVARQICDRNPNIVAHSFVSWRAGNLLDEDDSVILKAAFEDLLTFVTYDNRTIAPLLSDWAERSITHAGVVFIDRRTIRQEDIGGQVRALIGLLQERGDADWTNVVTHLRSAD